MTLFTEGPINITPVGLGRDLDLESLVSMCADNTYGPTPPSSGWGAIRIVSVEEEKVSPVARTNVGVPGLDDRFNSSVFLGRWLFDRWNQRVAQRLPEGVLESDPIAAHDLVAVDVMILEVEESVAAIVGTQDSWLLEKAILPQLRSLLRLLKKKPGPVVPFGELMPQEDLFLWIIDRWHRAPDVGNGLRLSGVRTVQAVDGANHKTRVLDSVSLERPEVLALVGTPRVNFGPMKLVLRDSQLGLTLDFFMGTDGSFSPHVGSSFYSSGPLPRVDLGLRLAHDVAVHVIPRLLRSFRDDRSWHQGRINEFRKSARDQLAKVLAI